MFPNVADEPISCTMASSETKHGKDMNQSVSHLFTHVLSTELRARTKYRYIRVKVY